MPANEDKDLETHSENVDFSSKDRGAMSDAHYASELIQDAFPTGAGRKAQAAIGEAFEALRRLERALPAEVLRNRQRAWTERRVKAIWFREARRIDHYEIQDLTAIAVEEARIERQRLRARELRLEAFLAAHQEGANCADREQEGRGTGGLDLPGNGGAFAAEDEDQTHWGM